VLTAVIVRTHSSTCSAVHAVADVSLPFGYGLEPVSLWEFGAG
jgi:hypothetical protein